MPQQSQRNCQPIHSALPADLWQPITDEAAQTIQGGAVQYHIERIASLYREGNTQQQYFPRRLADQLTFSADGHMTGTLEGGGTFSICGVTRKMKCSFSSY